MRFSNKTRLFLTIVFMALSFFEVDLSKEADTEIMVALHSLESTMFFILTMLVGFSKGEDK